MLVLCIVAIISVLIKADNFKNPVVSTEYGDVIGTWGATLKGRTYYAFYSIPYASKPIGDARFEEAQEPEPWLKPIDGTSPPPVCNQVNKNGEHIGQEDCLYLNVFTPTNVKNQSYPLPVIVSIHGGAFYFFSSNNYGPRYLLDKDIILVTFNYRLGIFGFLSTENELVPGNNGLKDQTLALGWVHRNIENFGGNPGSVTLFGYSAGAVSVHYHYFSILSRGLFQRGYIMGGSAFNIWAVQKNSLKRAMDTAEIVDCPTVPLSEMVECLRQAPADKLALVTLRFIKFYRTPLSPWGPVLDNKWSENPFLQEYPIQSMLANRHYNVPLIASDTPCGGLFPVAEFIEKNDAVQKLDDNWEELAPYFLDTIDTVPPKQQTQAAEFIRYFYFGDSPFIENRSAIVKVATERLYLADMGRALSTHAIVNPRIYFYIFNFQGIKSSFESLSGSKNKYGPSHVEDLYYLMNTSSADQPIEKDEIGLRMIDKMTEMFYNFAKTGKPVFPGGGHWLPVRGTISFLRFLRIDSPDKAVMETKKDLGNANFWASLPIHEPWAGRILL